MILDKRLLEPYLGISKVRWLLENDMLLFLFGYKPTILVFLDAENKKEFHSILELFESFARMVKQREVFCYIFEEKKFLWIKSEFAFLLSDRRIPYKSIFKKNGEYNHKKLGTILGFPKCCIKKFLKEYHIDNGDGRVLCYNSAKRYLKQLKELKIKKDPFEIKLLRNKKINSKISGFIPCSPNCKRAIKIIKKLDTINKIVKK